MTNEKVEIPEELTSAILGVVQGLTEFLPVSSSGHLVFFQHLLPKLPTNPVAFELLLHIGTLLPVLLVYRKDLFGISKDLVSGELPFWEREGVRLLLLIVIGSIPTAVIGIGFKDLFEQLFSNMHMVGIAFAITGTALYSIRFAPTSSRDLQQFNWKIALIIGLVQGLAITPGISRSGSTIVAALFLGVKRDLAAKYSFLLSIPAILGAFVLKLDDVQGIGSLSMLSVGFLASMISGYFALVLLLKLVNTGDFSKFCWYLWGLAMVALLVASGGFIA